MVIGDEQWWAHQDRKRSERLPVRLMNNTKWREVWLALTEMRLRIYFAYADGDDWNAANSGKLQGPFPVSYVYEKGIRDPGIGGPFLYKEILWVRVPRIPQNDVEAFVERVRSLGQLPLHLDSDYVEIRGYENASGAIAADDVPRR